jgi:hypothetical protein
MICASCSYSGSDYCKECILRKDWERINKSKETTEIENDK